jgi:hypothetical protein
VCLAALGTGIGCQLLAPPASSTADSGMPPLPGQPTGVFTTMRPTMGAAFADFMNQHPAATQPIEFPHDTHIGKNIMCTVCHEGVDKGQRAGLPSVRTCMICHAAIATDKPRIIQITAMQEKGIDLSWQRVYGFTNDDSIKFNHAPHIRAKVECATCHGDLSKMTVAQRAVDHTMGFCVNCHNERKAPVDCLTCHH